MLQLAKSGMKAIAWRATVADAEVKVEPAKVRLRRGTRHADGTRPLNGEGSARRSNC